MTEIGGVLTTVRIYIVRQGVQEGYEQHMGMVKTAVGVRQDASHG